MVTTAMAETSVTTEISEDEVAEAITTTTTIADLVVASEATTGITLIETAATTEAEITRVIAQGPSAGRMRSP